jgi:hypothetical protein
MKSYGAVGVGSRLDERLETAGLGLGVSMRHPLQAHGQRPGFVGGSGRPDPAGKKCKVFGQIWSSPIRCRILPYRS